MGRLMSFVTPLHQRSARDYLQRMTDDKVSCMRRAREYGEDYWDGPRRYGYGGYAYDGRWKPVAERLVHEYRLPDDASILDVGCGKAHLLYELKMLLPNASCVGLDVSSHAIATAPEGIRAHLRQGAAQDRLPWPDRQFDLVLSLGCLHNLRVFELQRAVGEIERVGRNKFVMVESYRNEQELFNLQCWALTAEAFFDCDEWVWLYRHLGYTGDYEFIYFE